MASVVAKKLQQFLEVLAGYGLMVNVSKCQLYCSPDISGDRTMRVEGSLLRGVEAIEIMGLSMLKGMSACELIQPLLARAKTKFWGIKHLLRCKAPLAGRLALFERVVARSRVVMSCCSAARPGGHGVAQLPAEHAAGLAPHIQQVPWGDMGRL